jgi:hypothetical protein
VNVGPPHRKHRRHRELGGILYEIVVTPFDDVYRAEWTCDGCGEPGSWAPVSGTSEQAFELAYLAIGVHHSLVHAELPPTRAGTKRK